MSPAAAEKFLGGIGVAAAPMRPPLGVEGQVRATGPLSLAVGHALTAPAAGVSTRDRGNPCHSASPWPPESASARVREHGITEKRMFGGLCFLLHGKLLALILQGLADRPPRAGTGRSGPSRSRMSGCYDITRRPMKVGVLVGPEGVDREADLREWVPGSGSRARDA